MSPQQETSPSPNRARIRSGSFGNLLGGKPRGATLHEDQVFDPLDESPASTSKRAETTFRRKKSIELSDIVEGGFTSREGGANVR
jgi:actin-like ATPase involved in cell morphogenesis